MKYDHHNIENARKLRRDMTPWERKLWYLFLKDYPVRFQRQKAVLNYIVDFYCGKAKLVVELDGGGHYSPEEREKDNQRTLELENHAIQVIRFSNKEVDQQFYSVCTVIDQEVKSRI